VVVFVASIERAIIGFHQDEFDDWVADLQCGHTQHVRHQPPWQERPWVVNEEGRADHLGQTLGCKKCATSGEDSAPRKEAEDSNNLV